MHRDSGIINVIEGDVLALALQWFKSEEVVEDVLGEVGGDGSDVLVRNWRDKDRIAVEELKVNGESVVILRILVPERVEDRRAVGICLVEGSVDIIHETVTVHRAMRQGLNCWTVSLLNTHRISSTLRAASATRGQR